MAFSLLVTGVNHEHIESNESAGFTTLYAITYIIHDENNIPYLPIVKNIKFESDDSTTNNAGFTPYSIIGNNKASGVSGYFIINGTNYTFENPDISLRSFTVGASMSLVEAD